MYIYGRASIDQLAQYSNCLSWLKAMHILFRYGAHFSELVVDVTMKGRK